ncbi:hypothetical protein B9G53_24880 [Pseudanabaena sp. SR411]|uniref:hypothetical protein n=1 Tax=Pseudanabaena sp. SR411 TaxID=1980935 RepID=UPI000B9981E4|nr:hypothetical protein [Pseudanabaena sp. SR411]OYQ61927.1 hypothetical protein B9G53_24880 [Pseudanabaena sp. SR411]
MIIEIVDKLIDRCLQLINHRKEQNQEIYSDFITPIMSSFEELHQGYVESFNLYRELIQSIDYLMDLSHPVFERIRRDSLLSSELRAKTAALNSFDSDPIVGSFVRAITLYVLGQEQYNAVILNGYRPTTNASRERITMGLREVVNLSTSDEDKRHRSLAIIDEMIVEKQGEHFYIMSEFSKLKVKLLNPTLKSRN